MSEQTYWCVYHDHDELPRHDTLRRLRSESIDAFLAERVWPEKRNKQSWNYFKRRGFSCRRVRIVEADSSASSSEMLELMRLLVRVGCHYAEHMREGCVDCEDLLADVGAVLYSDWATKILHGNNGKEANREG